MEIERAGYIIMDFYVETHFSKLDPVLQEHIYKAFNTLSPREKIMVFTKLKYGNDLTFKELSKKMHYYTARVSYSEILNSIRSGIYEEV